MLPKSRGRVVGVQGVVQRLPSRFLQPKITGTTRESLRAYVADLEAWLESEEIRCDVHEILVALDLQPDRWYRESIGP